MLYFIIVWIIIISICYLLGTLILNQLKANCFERKGDRFIIAVWLGIVVSCLLLLTISLVLPLSPLVGVTVATILVLLSLCSPQIRTEIIAFRLLLSSRKMIGFLTVTVAVAALTSQQIVWFDTGLYHLGSIRWLSQFGAVPGIALIHTKFGFTSSWFTFAAPLIPEFIGDKIGAITNGFVFLIAIFHFLICLSRISTKHIDLADWFSISFFGIIISVYVITILTGSPILISFSNDVPVTFLIGVVAWSILIISSHRQLLTVKSNTNHLNIYLIPLILSLGAVSIKLTAIPALLVSLLLYFSIKPFQIQRILWGSIIVILLLLPNTTFGIITSGCPFYPSRVMCLDLPWSVTEQKITEETEAITGIDNSNSKENRILLAAQNRFKWLKNSRKLQILSLLLIGSLIFTSRILWKLNNVGEIWLITLAILGMSFIIVTSPLLRFGISYFIIVPCLWLARFYLSKKQKTQQILGLLQRSKLSQNTRLLSLGLLGLLLIIFSQVIISDRLFFPAKLPTAQLIRSRVNDIEYTYPANWAVRCWNAELPCAAVPINKYVQLRDPLWGIGAGFVLKKAI